MNKPAVIISVFTVLIVVILFVVAINQSPSTSTPASTPPTVGASEINFTLKDLDNKNITLADFKGHDDVFVEFFAVWCPHCQHESTIIDDLYTQFYNKNVQFLSVQANQYGKNYESSGGSDTTPATLSDLKWFKTNFGVQYPILQDSSIATANKYGVTGYPTIFIINKQGKVTYTGNGEVAESTLLDALKKVTSS